MGRKPERDGSNCSPHPRGCSQPDRPALLDALLLPAPAGMFRPPRPAGPSSASAPHTCGDVPLGALLPHTLDVCSPHPRGCSPVARGPGRPDSLLPAPAGMFPARTLPASGSSSAPRTRGDVPRQSHHTTDTSLCSPHPRGCSLPDQRLPARHFLLPAPAGMFPRRRPPWAVRAPAPRTRGDVPACSNSGVTCVNCSPHPRGCSSAERGGDARIGLLPTPAGMFPRARSSGCRASTAPRTRGDVPGAVSLTGTIQTCSPHPRGCSHQGRRQGRRAGLLVNGH